MSPFANWTFFGLLLLYAVLPILVLGLLGKASARLCFIITLPILGLVFAHHDNTVLRLAGAHLRFDSFVLPRMFAESRVVPEFFLGERFGQAFQFPFARQQALFSRVDFR